MNLYMHVSFLAYAYMYVLFYAKRGEEFGEFMHVYLLVYAYVCKVLCTSLNILMFIAMHELRGASMKLIFNPYIYNSMSFVIIKKGEIVGPMAHHSSFDNDQLM